MTFVINYSLLVVLLLLSVDVTSFKHGSIRSDKLLYTLTAIKASPSAISIDAIDDYKKFTVVELKNILRENKLPVSGVKDVLIRRLTDLYTSTSATTVSTDTSTTDLVAADRITAPKTVTKKKTVVAATTATTASQIFYPSIVDDDNKLTSQEDALYNLFLKQISEVSSKAYDSSNSSSISNDNNNDRSRRVGGSMIPNKSLLERPIVIRSDASLEIAYKNKVVFGNYIKQSPSTSPSSSKIDVRLTSGEVINIDVGQVICCWDLLADDVTPCTPQGWAEVASEALEILGNMSPRKSDLNEFWTIIAKRSLTIPVDSLDLGIYIFQERKFRSWLNPSLPASASGAYALSAAQRYVAALLLNNDEYHFKRRQSTYYQGIDAGNDDGDDDSHDELDDFVIDIDGNDDDSADDSEGEYDDDDEGSITIVEGGYRPLDEGVSMFKEGETFVDYYTYRKNGNNDEAVAAAAVTGTTSSHNKARPAVFREACVTRQIRALELYSMASPKTVPSPTVKHLLKKLKKDLSPAGARSIINDMKIADSTVTSTGRPSSTGVASTVAASYTTTAWSKEVIAEANKLNEEMQQKRKELSTTFVSRAGKKGPTGRMEYRGFEVDNPVICIDSARATFFDDAFSLSPNSGEILVHVTDVVGCLRRYPLLQEISRERLSTSFLPSGPLHMLPPQALDALKLSATSPNEVITVAISVDDNTGQIYGFRVFPSVIGPVFSIDIETADEIIDGVGVETSIDMSSNITSSISNRMGYPDTVIHDLIRTQMLVQNAISRQPWVDEHFSQSNARNYKVNKRTGTLQQDVIDKTPCNRMVNALLTMYSNASALYCESKGVSYPVAWENRDRIDTSRIRRFGTQPLRNWIAQLQQKQLRSALKLEIPMGTKECAMAVSYYNRRKQDTLSIGAVSTSQQLAFESLESHCATMMAASDDDDSYVLEAVVLDKGLVKLNDFRVTGRLQSSNSQEKQHIESLPKGQAVRVKVRKLVHETKSILLDLVT